METLYSEVRLSIMLWRLPPIITALRLDLHHKWPPIAIDLDRCRFNRHGHHLFASLCELDEGETHGRGTQALERHCVLPVVGVVVVAAVVRVRTAGW